LQGVRKRDNLAATATATAKDNLSQKQGQGPADCSTVNDQSFQNHKQEQEDCSTAEGQPSQNKDGGQGKCPTANDQPSENTHGDEQEDVFVFEAVGVPESSETSKERAEFHLQLEWMSVSSSFLPLYRRYLNGSLFLSFCRPVRL